MVSKAISRIRKGLEEINRTDSEFTVNISLGAATALTTEELSKALKVSDERMYQDKFIHREKQKRAQGASLPNLTYTSA